MASEKISAFGPSQASGGLGAGSSTGSRTLGRERHIVDHSATPSDKRIALQPAELGLGDVFEAALSQPQVIDLPDGEAVVVVNTTTYDVLIEAQISEVFSEMRKTPVRAFPRRRSFPSSRFSAD
ncbi:hypothetical protein ACVWWO_003728 [Bradyrhizobium sp. F1.13.1]